MIARHDAFGPRVGRRRPDRPVPPLVRRSGRGGRPPARGHDTGDGEARRRGVGAHGLDAWPRRTGLRVLHESRERESGRPRCEPPSRGWCSTGASSSDKCAVVGPVSRLDRERNRAVLGRATCRGHRVGGGGRRRKVTRSMPTRSTPASPKSMLASPDRSHPCRSSGVATWSASTSSSCGRAAPIACTTASSIARARDRIFTREQLAP